MRGKKRIGGDVMQAVLPGINAIEKPQSETKLNLRITWRSLLALFALTICTGEMHEQIHIQTGRIICGGYGERDFNVWQLAKPCAEPQLAFLATLIGPLWSFAVMWTGAFLLLKAKTVNYRTIGFALVFAPLPFARIFTAIMGGGDEKVVLRAFLEKDMSLGTTKILAAAVVIAICLPPIIIAYRNAKNRFAALYVIGFSVMPLVVLGLYVLTFLNGLLKSGFLSAAPFLGTPLLILTHSLLMVVILIFSRRRLLEINSETDSCRH
jgi:hypothetical protein